MSPESVAEKLKSREAPPPDDEPSRWRFGLRHMLHLVFYCALACWLIAVVGIPALLLLIVLFVMLFLSFALVIIRRRSAQQEALLTILALTVDRDLPLGPALDAVSDQFTGRFRRKVRALSHYANSGLSLPEALDEEPGTLPRDVDLLARIGYESGTLPEALRETSRSRGSLQPVWAILISRVLYFLCLLYIIQVVGGFLLYFVVPKYEAIQRDFGITSPPAMTLIIQAGHVLVDWAPYYVGFVLLQVIALLLLPLSLFGGSRYEVPILEGLFKRWHMALVIRAVSWAIEGGLPLPRAFEILAERYPSRSMRARLGKVLLDVRHGSDWVQSLAYHGLLGNADAAVLESARRAGNLPWALRETAASGDRRIAYRLQAFVQLLMPIVLIAFGALIGLIVVGYFSPLIKIIEVLM